VEATEYKLNESEAIAGARGNCRDQSKIKDILGKIERIRCMIERIWEKFRGRLAKCVDPVA
jgi:hypothetical protein